MSNTARAIAKLSAFGLLSTAFVFAYLNTTTASPMWSSLYIGGVAICAAAAALKLASAEGIENAAFVWADNVTSLVPFVAIGGCAWQALHYWQPGLSGFMAGVAVIAGTFNVTFGIWDAAAGWLGAKYHDAIELAERMQAAADAAGNTLRNGHDKR